MKITTIKEVDLKKLMKQKGIKSLYQLSKVSGVNYNYLHRAYNGYIALSENAWNKLKVCL